MIVGPNNSGKSNLLRALMVALSLATEGDFKKEIRRRNITSHTYVYEGKGYDWGRDIPRSLQNNKEVHTVFKLTFEFSQEEKYEFSEKIGINLSKSLQMMFKLYRDRTEYNIIMPGRAKAPMEEKIADIALFIRSKLDYQYIPCVRTSEFTSDYFAQLLAKELRGVEESLEFKECVQKIKDLQLPIVKRLEERLATALKTFLPNVKKVEIDNLISSNYLNIDRYRLRRTPINIDDGNLTSLDDKGDGVKSLAAISLVQSLSFENATNKSLILCIEEPESHLHPEAIHSLRNVILELTEKTNVQVVISTHSPLLIDREHSFHNVQIDNQHNVKPCESISEIRTLLGIRLTDNLDGILRVVFVEGESDKKILKKLCSEKNEVLKSMIECGSLEFVSVNSASKMNYHIRLYNSLLIPSLVVLDSDDSGMCEHRKLIESKLKRNSEILLIKSKGMLKCEIEDWVNYKEYKSSLFSQFGIDVDNREFKNKQKPWSDRLKDAAQNSPTAFNEEIEKQVKIFIADLVVSRGLAVIPEFNLPLVSSLIENIAYFCEVDN